MHGWVVLTGDSIRLTKFNSCGFIEWSKQYNMAHVQYGQYDFTALKNGDYALTYRHTKNTVGITGVIRFDQNGNIAWSKSYGENNYNHYPHSIIEDSQGNIYLHALIINTSLTASHSSLTKLDANGNLLWTRLFDGGDPGSSAIMTSDQGILVKCNGNLLKTDTSGKTIWTKVIATSQNSFAPVAVSDGFIFSSTNGQSWNKEFYKFDYFGNLLWGGAKGISINSNLTELFKTLTGNFVGMFLKPVAGNSYVTLIEFDKDLNIIAENSISIPNYLTGNSVCFLNDATPIACGNTPAGELFVARLTTDYKSGCDMQSSTSAINNHPVTLGGITYNESIINFISYNENITFDTVSSNLLFLCPAPKLLQLGNDTSLCTGDISIKNLTADKFDFYSWSTGETTAMITVTHSGTYILNVNDSCGEFALTDTVIVTINAINANAGNDVVLCENESTLLKVNPCDSCSYAWNNGSMADTTFIKQPGTYIVTVQNKFGCIGSDTVEVQQYKCECDLYLPNAFTPNNDGVNDLFNPSYYCDPANYQLIIFNRWGQKIFSADNPVTGWNGKYDEKEMPGGVYMYFLKYTAIIKGKTTDIKKSGTVALIR